MIVIRLLALGLLFHEGLNLGIRGQVYLKQCFLPTFGLFLKPRQVCGLHLFLIALCGAMLAEPQWRLLDPCLFLTLSLILACYSLRLSNHLVLAWFMALLLCLGLALQRPVHWVGLPTPFVYVGIQMLVIMTYALAFFHKLNTDYFSPGTSCGAWLAGVYLKIRRIESKSLERVLKGLAIYGTILLELLIPCLLLSPRTRPLGLILAVLLQLGFGLLVHVHFSTLMFAGLAAFIPDEAWAHSVSPLFSAGGLASVLFVLLGLMIGFRFGVWNGRGYRLPMLALVQQMCFGAVSVAALRVGAILLAHGPLPSGGGESRTRLLLLTVVGAGFLLNGLCPYLGIKTNFSMAMFSNLRPDRWCHFVVPKSWRRFTLAAYVQVLHMEGLPDEGEQEEWSDVDITLKAFKQWESLKFSMYFFHEGMRLLARTAGPEQRMRVVYSEGDVKNDIQDYAAEVASHPPRYLKLGLFPYTLPLDCGERHCD